jgi:hypothetical protein
VALAGLALLLMGDGGRSVEQTVRDFDLIVFRNEYRDGVAQHLRKWATPIRVYIDSRAGDADLHRRLTKDHLARLAAISGHEIRLVHDRDSANLLAVFEHSSKLGELAEELFPDADKIRKIIANSVCIGRFYTNGRHEIFKAVVIIPPDRAASKGKLPACVVEEITQVLGLPNDSSEVFPSIFNDRSVDDDLTEIDTTLIRLLYDPRLRPGMPREEALGIVRRILEATRP